METKLFFIKALSNLHVGSGEINYGLVDNLIQRDPVTGLPTINSSSLKGALRKHFEKVEKGKVDVISIFGSEPQETKDRRQGSVHFFDADLVSLPVRISGADFSYVHISTPQQLNRLWHHCERLGITNAQFFNGIANLNVQKENTPVRIEDIEAPIPSVKTSSRFADVVGEQIAILNESQMEQLCDNEHLPVITRNSLDDGQQSNNLFYEQVLPRYSRLVTIVMGEGKDFNNFCNCLNNQVVQIGAHATIGYGFCQFKLYQPTNKTSKQ